MALADLLQKVQAEGEARAAAVVAAAHAEAERLQAEARRRAETGRATALTQVEAELRTAGQRDIEAARLNGARMALEAREAILERIFARAGALLAQEVLSQTSSLQHDLEQALSYLDAEGARLRCPAPLAARVRGLLAAHPEVSLEEADGLMGLFLTARDGSVDVDASLPTRLERLRPRLAIHLVSRLGAAS